MTKKDFVALAKALMAVTPLASDGPKAMAAWMHSVAAVCEVCAASNPRFDRARFLKACGVGE